MNQADLWAERIELLRKEAGNYNLEGVMVYSRQRGALSWFCGYSPLASTNFAALWVPTQGQPALGVRQSFDVERAREISKLDVKVISAPEELLPAAVHRIGWVGGDYYIDETPLSFLVALKPRQIELADLKRAIDEWRMIKPPADVKALRMGTAIGNMAIKAAGEVAGVGETDFALAARVEAAARAAGAATAHCLIGIGDGASITETRGLVVGSTDPVFLKLILNYGSVCAQTSGTLLPSSPLPHQQKALGACQITLQAMIDTLIPGTPVDQIVAAGDRALSSNSLYGAKQADFGSGIGTDIPEQPHLVYGTKRNLEAGMVLALQVSVRSTGGPTAIASKTVVITEIGSVELA